MKNETTKKATKADAVRERLGVCYCEDLGAPIAWSHREDGVDVCKCGGYFPKRDPACGMVQQWEYNAATRTYQLIVQGEARKDD